jgi:tRNA-dihydrouridine synthase
MYKGSADWTLIGEVKNNPRMSIPVFLNGDIDTPEKVKLVRNKYGVDGVMIGRAAIGNPWFFNEVKHYLKTGKHLAPPTLNERIDVCRLHLVKSMEWKGDRLGVLEMRRHYANYFHGYPNIKPFREKLVMADTIDDIDAAFAEMKEYYYLVPDKLPI